MNINLYSQHFSSIGHSNTWSAAMQLISKKLIEKYKDVNFNLIPLRTENYKEFDPVTDKYFDKFNHEPITDMTMIVENTSTKKYLVVNYWDKGLAQVRNWHDYQENCVGILASSGCQDSDLTYEVHENVKLVGTSFMGCTPDEENIINNLRLQQHTRIIPEKLWFSYSPYLFRKYLLDNDPRFDMQKEGYLPFNDFLYKLSQYKINMDINSVAEISCRSSQILGLGQVLIRPKLRNKLKNELIDMVHYVEVKSDNLADYKELADAYYDTFNRVKHDEELIHFISTNARKYYEENCTIDAHTNIVLDGIDLSKLI